MKKLILSSFLMAFLTLSSCGTSRSSNKDVVDEYFKEYTLSNELNSTEKENVLKSITDKLTQVSNISASYKTGTSYFYDSSEFEANYSYKFLKDNTSQDALIVNSESDESEKTTHNGITSQETRKVTDKKWDSLQGYIATDSVTQKNNETNPEHQYSKTPTAGTPKEVLINYFEHYLGISTNNLDVYKNSDNSYTAIYSYFERNVSGYEWGAETKEKITMTKRQNVYNFTSDFKVKDGYTYTGYFSNRDNDTGDWYNEVKRTQYTYISFSLTYGTKESASISTLNNSVKDKVVGASVKLQGFIANTTTYDNPSSIDTSSITGPNNITNANINKNDDNNFDIHYNFELERGSYYSGYRYAYALQIEKTTETFSGSGQKSYFNVVFNMSDYPQYQELIKVINASGRTFIVNNSDSSYLEGNMTISFINNTVTINSINLYYY